jgi:hypothetical protein
MGMGEGEGEEGRCQGGIELRDVKETVGMGCWVEWSGVGGSSIHPTNFPSLRTFSPKSNLKYLS